MSLKKLGISTKIVK
uniref:Uncharacterized protein n=1 Tax=Anguilla anguilla TaxID=7936 RepID=A0A0E9S6E7_ANGAN